MVKFLITYLLVTGIGAFLALAMPWLVVIGLFLLIVPGLVLILMPTAFLYGVIFTAGALPVLWLTGSEVAATFAGFAMLLLVTSTTTRPVRQRDLARYRASILPDVTPDQTVALSGVVRFELRYPRREKIRGVKQAGYACDGYCLAALFTPGVTAVTIDRPRRGKDAPLSAEARTYRLVPRPGCTSNAQVNFDAITPPLQNEAARGMQDYEAGKQLVASWALRLANEFCLIEEPAREHADFTIVQRESSDAGVTPNWKFGPGRLSTETVDIYHGEDLVLRSHQSTITTLAAILHIGTSGGIENFRFQWERSTTHSKRGHGSVDLSRLLGQHTNLAGKPGRDLDAQRQANLPLFRAQLAKALDDPALTGSSPDFKVLTGYFQAVGKAAQPEDIDLITRLVADTRLPEYRGIYQLELTLEQVRPIYAAYCARAARSDATLALRNSSVGVLVRQLRADAFALIGPEQETLLADPARRLLVPELVRALGYGGSAEGRRLLGLLKMHGEVLAGIREQYRTREIRGYARQDEHDANIALVAAAKEGLCLLGPKAGDLRDELDSFLTSGTLPENLVGGHEMSEWDLILARMGKPIEAIAKPRTLGGTEENYRRNLRDRVERWKPDRR